VTSLILDLVSRLRYCSIYQKDIGHLLEEAASEIERLNEIIEQSNSGGKQHEDNAVQS